MDDSIWRRYQETPAVATDHPGRRETLRGVGLEEGLPPGGIAECSQWGRVRQGGSRRPACAIAWTPAR